MRDLPVVDERSVPVGLRPCREVNASQLQRRGQWEGGVLFWTRQGRYDGRPQLPRQDAAGMPITISPVAVGLATASEGLNLEPQPTDEGSTYVGISCKVEPSETKGMVAICYNRDRLG